MLKLEGPEPEQIAIDHRSRQDSDGRQGTAELLPKFNKPPSKIASNDIETLRTYGFTEQQIMEAIVIIGFSQFANTVAFGLGTVPDFHNAKINAALRESERAAQTTQEARATSGA